MAAQADPQKPSAERETYKELIAIKKNTQFTEENQLSGERNESIGGENKKEEGPLSKKGEGAKISQSFPPITSLILSFIIVLIPPATYNSLVALNLISGQRSSVSCRFTRLLAR